MHSKKYVQWEVKNIISCVICRLLAFAEWIRDTQRGRDREWITLPLNKQGKKRREDVCFRKSQDRTREACFLYPLFKQPYSCCNSSSILVHSRGFNLHSGPIIRFANQFLSPLCGPLSVLFIFYKVSKNGESCSSYLYSKSQGGKISEWIEGFCNVTGRLRGIRSRHVSIVCA